MVNIMILAFILRKWKTLQFRQTYFQILGCLSLSRAIYLLSMFFINVLFVFYPSAMLDNILRTILTIEIMFLSYTNLWFATILCVFYCVKITSYNFKFLIFLRKKISTGVPWFLLASLLLSASSSLPFGHYVYELAPKNLTNGEMVHTSLYNNEVTKNEQTPFLLYLVGSCPPLVIFCITICLLVHSLWIHTRRMRKLESGFGKPNLESHFNALKSMSLFFVLQMIFVIVIYVFLLGRLNSHNIWRLISSIINCFPPFFHSFYIISSNRELKTWICVFQVLGTKS
ncbi:taste receptor type 2 member 39-like [Anomaloglossus baeobatrachus]|uniref:taste receptor type 2 member 39-like n=1 Tax=Anomaloglossus baeobatrachus TaxID=238106 RepID=UPI003F50AA97